MYAQCPECLTVFSLDADTLAQNRGAVACGHCGHAFDALASLTGQLPPEPFERLPARSSTGSLPRLELAVYRPPPESSPLLAESSELEFDPSSPLAFSPRFARGRRSPTASTPSSPDRRWPWVVICLVLLLALGMQLAWAKRDALISDPRVGGWLRDACATLGCRLPLVQDVHQLQLIAREVRARPGPRGALTISATVRNNAPFAQPWPVVALTLSDAHGKPVAMRRLRPSEYLADHAVLRAGLPAGSNAALVFEVRDPGDAAAVFQFAFE